MHPMNKMSFTQALISSPFLWSWGSCCGLTGGPHENGVPTDAILDTYVAVHLGAFFLVHLHSHKSPLAPLDIVFLDS